jgi:hypothetical protein
VAVIPLEEGQKQRVDTLLSALLTCSQDLQVNNIQGEGDMIEKAIREKMPYEKRERMKKEERKGEKKIGRKLE